MKKFALLNILLLAFALSGPAFGQDTGEGASAPEPGATLCDTDRTTEEPSSPAPVDGAEGDSSGAISQ